MFKVDVADTTGAGDAFTAGFVYKVCGAQESRTVQGFKQSTCGGVVWCGEWEHPGWDHMMPSNSQGLFVITRLLCCAVCALLSAAA